MAGLPRCGDDHRFDAAPPLPVPAPFPPRPRAQPPAQARWTGWGISRVSASTILERESIQIPATAAAPPASWKPSCTGEEASRSPKMVAPITTAQTGSSVSMTGRLSYSAPSPKALWPNSALTTPVAARAYGSHDTRVAQPTLENRSTVLLVSASTNP